MTDRRGEPDPSKLTLDERAVLASAGATMQLFRELPAVHPSHERDVADATHLIQRIVMSRVARRCNPEDFEPVAGG